MSGRRLILGVATALAGLTALSACQPAPPPAASAQPPRFSAIEGVGYIVFNAPILARSRDFLISDMEGLIGAGARTIRIAINSPGGDIEAAQGIVDYMNRAHTARGIDFEVYGNGLVASAATYVFLAAQRRYTRPNGGFLFHAAGMVSSGAVSAERLREEARKIDDYEGKVRALLKARTRLTDGAIDVYLHRTVILTADDARRDGVVDAIQAFPAPPGTLLPTIATRPNPAQPSTEGPVPPSPGGSR